MTDPTDPNGIVVVTFKPLKVFSLRMLRVMLWFIGGMVVGALSGSKQLLHNPVYYERLITYFLVVFILVFVRRIYLKKNGGTPAIRFEKDALILPRTIYSRKTYSIPYANLLSIAVYGKGKRQRIIFDTKKRAFLYPLIQFTETDALQTIKNAVKTHVLMLPDGAAQWLKMEERHNAAEHFSAIKPYATWGLIALISLIFCAQAFTMREDSIFPALDWGANAHALVWAGQWYRVLTANLLHANAVHLINNIIFVLVVGSLVERQLGIRRFVLLVLMTGMFSQLLSAFWQAWSPLPVMYSVGISGACFGLLGGLAMMNRKLGTKLPGGYRLPPRAWIMLLALNFVIMPKFFPQIDTAAHVGGLLAGLFIGWILFLNYDIPTERPSQHPLEHALLILLLFLYGAGISKQLDHVLHAPLRAADHDLVVESVINASKPDPMIDNAVAWSVATDPNSSQAQLDQAVPLAMRSIDTIKQKYGEKRPEILEAQDTLATLKYRMGEFDAAIKLEETMARIRYDGSSQLARFFNAYVKQYGVRVIGDSSKPLPQLKLNSLPLASNAAWSFDITSDPMPNGGVVYALLKQGDTILGLLRVDIKPTKTNIHYTNWQMSAQPNRDAIQADNPGKKELVLVDYVTDNCYCNGTNAWYFPEDVDIAKLP